MGSDGTSRSVKTMPPGHGVGVGPLGLGVGVTVTVGRTGAVEKLRKSEVVGQALAASARLAGRGISATGTAAHTQARVGARAPVE